MANKQSVKTFGWGLLAGAITGAVTALLLAPKSGRELRKDINDSTQQAIERTSEWSRQAGDAVQSLAKKTTSLASEAKQAASQLVTDIRSRITSEADVEETAATSEEASHQ